MCISLVLRMGSCVFLFCTLLARIPTVESGLRRDGIPHKVSGELFYLCVSIHTCIVSNSIMSVYMYIQYCVTCLFITLGFAFSLTFSPYLFFFPPIFLSYLFLFVCLYTYNYIVPTCMCLYIQTYCYLLIYNSRFCFFFFSYFLFVPFFFFHFCLPLRTILLSVISLLNEPNTYSAANVDASVLYRKWRDSRGKDKQYIDQIR